MQELTEFQKQLAEKFPATRLLYGEPMAKHTSLRIGGEAEAMAFPQNVPELAALLRFCPGARILGAGTNILAPDEGLPGLTICLKDCLDGLSRASDTEIRAAAGVTMSRAAVFAANMGLAGMEFAHGIPGTVGGGIYMNAGAYGGELQQICKSVEILREDGEVVTIPGEEMEFSYRSSRLKRERAVVLSAIFSLSPAPAEDVKMRMKELQRTRSASQPLELPSAGSAFKRPANGYAAALIDGAGLKGYRVGGAAISTKHAGFAVNLGGATARDVRQLLGDVARSVYEDSGIRLEPEILFW